MRSVKDCEMSFLRCPYFATFDLLLETLLRDYRPSYPAVTALMGKLNGKDRAFCAVPN